MIVVARAWMATLGRFSAETLLDVRVHANTGIVNTMATGDGTFSPIFRSMHVHPAMSEVVQNVFVNLREA